MENDHLENLLNHISEEPVPKVAGNLESKVLRAVRMDAVNHLDFLWPEWFNLRPFALSVAVAAVGLGLIMGSVLAMPSTSSDEHMRQLFAFDAFGAEFNSVPHP